MVISKLPTAFCLGLVWFIFSFKVGRGVFFCLRKISYLENYDYVKMKPKFKSGMENMRL